MNKKRKWQKALKEDAIFIGPGFVLYTLFFFIPIIISLVYSFTDWDGIQKVINFVGFDNYIHAFTLDRAFLAALKFTLTFTFWGFIGVNVIGLFCAMLLNLPLRSRGVARTLIYLPSVVSVLIVGFLWKFMYRTVIPEIGKIIGSAFLQQQFLTKFDTIVYVILIPAVWQSVGFAMLVYLAGLQGIPSDLRESMILDGAGPVQRFRYLTIPFLIPSMITCAFSVTTGALKVYDIIVAMTDGGPGRASVSLALHIYREGLVAHDYGGGSAKAIIFSLIILAITVTQFFYLQSKEVEM